MAHRVLFSLMSSLSLYLEEQQASENTTPMLSVGLNYSKCGHLHQFQYQYEEEQQLNTQNS